MKNIALRMKNKEVATCLTIWKITQQTQKSKLVARERGEAICKRVGMRMLNKDLSDRFMIWSSSWRDFAAKEMVQWQQRTHNLQMEKNELEVFTVRVSCFSC